MGAGRTRCTYCSGEQQVVSFEQWARGRTLCEEHGDTLDRCTCALPNKLRELP